MVMRKEKQEVKEKKMCNVKNITYIRDKQRRNLVVYSVRKGSPRFPSREWMFRRARTAT
jgi:hypothetical protein